MKSILLRALLMILSLQIHAQEISTPDSILILLRPHDDMNRELSRTNFVCQSIKDSNPAIIINDSISVSTIISLLTSGAEVSMALDYDTNQQYYSLKRLPNGEFDLRTRFTIDATMNIYGMIALFRSGNYELVWIGKNEVEIGRERWMHPNIYAKMKEFIDINFNYDNSTE